MWHALMPIFSLLHLWGFPWKDYALSAPVGSLDIPPAPKVPAQVSSSSYEGGPMGSRALVDAFNPWDLIKAVGRGGRWIFVGRKHRHADVPAAASASDRPLAPSTSDISLESSQTPGFGKSGGRKWTDHPHGSGTSSESL